MKRPITPEPGQEPATRRHAGRGALLWIWTALVGVGSAILAQSLDGALLRSKVYLLQRAKYSAYDQGMTQHAYRVEQRWRGDAPIVVTPITETTNKLLGRMKPADLARLGPIPDELRRSLSWRDHQRWFHTQLLRKLTDLGARVVVFDVVFAEEQQQLDRDFAAAIRKHGRVILAGADDLGEQTDQGEFTHQIVPPTADLRDAAAGWAFTNLPLDADDAIRRFQWWFKGIDDRTGDDTLIPPLGVAAAALYAGADPRTVMNGEFAPRGTFLGHSVVSFPGRDTRFSHLTYFGPTNFPGGAGSKIDYSRVLFNQEPDLRAKIAGKVVFVGDSSLVAQDRHPSPVLSEGLKESDTRQMPGVEMQAHVTLTALTGAYVRPATPFNQALLLLASCMLVAVTGRMLSPRWLALVGTVMVAGLWIGSIWVLDRSLYYLDPVVATVGILFAAIVESAVMYVGAHKEQLHAARQLSRHVGRGVAKKLTEDNWVEMGGERREITLLFTDLQGFTSLSETMETTAIFKLLQDYYSVVIPMVDRHEGAVDKMMGDGLMAYFGWFPRHADHAARAVRCALEMQQALDEWQRRPENAHLPPLRTRIGIHTGIAMIGEVGMDERVGFTVIGDVVNVASRLEGMNKEYGTRVLISQVTKDAAGEIAPMVFRGEAVVRGRKEPLPVYSVELEPTPAQKAETARMLVVSV